MAKPHRQSREGPVSSVSKACRILRTIVGEGAPRLVDLTRVTALDKATTIRLLDLLQAEGLVLRGDDKRYRLGPEALLLGAAANQRIDMRTLARPSMLRICHAFEDTTILSVPSGIESVCLALEEGAFPIRANYLAVGSRRLLGLGAGSLALLAWMPDAERASMMEILEDRLRGHPRVTVGMVDAMVSDARRNGYALSLNVLVDRMGGVGVPILASDGRPVAALSIAALSDRITDRLETITSLLRQEAAICGQEDASTRSKELHDHARRT